MPSRSRSHPPEAAGRVRHWAEQLARCHLELTGMGFLAANHQEKTGELDLVMKDGETIVFVEVRQRRNAEYGSAAESLDAGKLVRMRRTARLFLVRRFGTEDLLCRFDAVLLSGQQDAFRLEHLRGIG